MALALLADVWTREQGGTLLALIVDHGLRPGSASEAAQAAERLTARGIAGQVLTVSGRAPDERGRARSSRSRSLFDRVIQTSGDAASSGYHALARGPALAERARAARFRVLIEACAAQGILHLLLGHHAVDQAETVLIRALSGSGPAGLAGMTPLTEAASVRILRPLLAVPPGRLRTTLVAAGADWVEDPSNSDATFLRPRLRLARRDRAGVGSATAALDAAAAASGRRRADAEARIAACLADRVSLRPEGYCVMPGHQAIDPDAFAALLQTIAGAPFPPPTRSVASLAAAPRPATLAGVRLLPAGRLGPGYLVARETAAMAPPVPAIPGVVWDGRFRLGAGTIAPPGATLGALGAAAARLRRASSLPAAILRTLPAVFLQGKLLAVPHLVYPDAQACARIPLMFSPPRPAAGAPFLGSGVVGDA
jgi:tRNA(Ile)-lysidine synthase